MLFLPAIGTWKETIIHIMYLYKYALEKIKNLKPSRDQSLLQNKEQL